MKRTMDATFFNEVANHPEVRPFLGGKDELDLKAMLANPRNFGFQTDTGGFVVEELDHGLYECHSMFLPEGRGGQAMQCAREAITFMFAATECMEIVTKLPDGNRAAQGLAIRVGFENRFERENAWDNGDGTKSKVSYAGLNYWRWLATDPSLPALGGWFHRRLEELIGRAPNHEDDTAHDKAAGASVAMLRAGNPAKAVALYNRWAKVAGYQTIMLISLSPPVVDVVDAVITVKNGDMELLLCR